MQATQTSTTYRAIAQIAEYVEDELDPDEFAFLDGGLTLQINASSLAQISQVNSWHKLQQNFEQVGGCIYSPDFIAI